MNDSRKQTDPKKMKTNNKSIAGGLLVEILIVIAIIGLVALITIPIFVGAKNRSDQITCSDNLKKMWKAKEAYAADNRGTNAIPVPTLSDLVKETYLQKMPICPDGGFYFLNFADEAPTCSLGEKLGHIASPFKR